MSMSLPNPSQLRRPKTILSPDGTTAKFLYAIIKQLDLKAIDWNEVASHLDITNGHAARMRYSRFKTQIEGTLKEQKPKPKDSDNKDTKSKTGDKKRGRVEEVVNRSEPDVSVKNLMYGRPDEPLTKRVKAEDVQSMPVSGAPIKSEIVDFTTTSPSDTIKVEPGTRIHHPTVTTYTVPLLSSPPPRSKTSTEQTVANNSKSKVTQQSSHPSKTVIKSEPPNVPQATSQQGKHRMQSAVQSRMQHQPHQLGSHAYQPQQYYSQSPYLTMNTYAYPSHLSPHIPGSYYPSAYPYYQQQHRQSYQLQQAPQQQLLQQYGQTSRPMQVNQSLQSDVVTTQTLNSPSSSRDLTAAAAASYPWPYSESMISNPIKSVDNSLTTTTATTITPLTQNIITPHNSATNIVPEVSAFNPEIDFDVFESGLAGDFSEWVMSGDIVPPIPSAVSSVDLNSNSNPVEGGFVNLPNVLSSAELVDRMVDSVDTVVVDTPGSSGVISSQENAGSSGLPANSNDVNVTTGAVPTNVNGKTDTNIDVSNLLDSNPLHPSIASSPSPSLPVIQSAPILQPQGPSNNTATQMTEPVHTLPANNSSATSTTSVSVPISPSAPIHNVQTPNLTTTNSPSPSSSSNPSGHTSSSSTPLPINVPQFTTPDSSVNSDKIQNGRSVLSPMSLLPLPSSARTMQVNSQPQPQSTSASSPPPHQQAHQVMKDATTTDSKRGLKCIDLGDNGGVGLNSNGDEIIVPGYQNEGDDLMIITDENENVDLNANVRVDANGSGTGNGNDNAIRAEGVITGFEVKTTG